MSKKDEEFEIVDLEHLEKNDVQLIVSPNRMSEILGNVGYTINKGKLIDKDTQKEVYTEDGTPINLEKMKRLALIGGSHVFVKGIAGYSQVLAQKREINFTKPKSKD